MAEVYEAIMIEAAYDLYGNLHIDLPKPGEYADIEDEEELLDFIDSEYSNIRYIRNNANPS